jgi:hypothetical protein
MSQITIIGHDANNVFINSLNIDPNDTDAQGGLGRLPNTANLSVIPSGNKLLYFDVTDPKNPVLVKEIEI